MMRKAKNPKDHQIIWEGYKKLLEEGKAEEAGKWLKYASEKGWLEMMPYRYYRDSCLEDVDDLVPSIRSLKSHGRTEEAVKLTMEILEKKPEHIPPQITRIMDELPEKSKLEFALKAAEKLTPEQLADVAHQLIKQLPDKDRLDFALKALDKMPEGERVGFSLEVVKGLSGGGAVRFIRVAVEVIPERWLALLGQRFAVEAAGLFDPRDAAEVLKEVYRRLPEEDRDWWMKAVVRVAPPQVGELLRGIVEVG